MRVKLGLSIPFYSIQLFLLLLDVAKSLAEETCSNKTCKLPDCLCMSTSPPFGYKPEEIPHLVFLAFDYAPSRDIDELYMRLIENRTNPNGCPVSFTFFTSHQVNARHDNTTLIKTYADYQFLNNLFNDGNDFGSHFVLDKERETSWIDSLKSIQHSREMLKYHANIPLESVKLVHVDGISDETFHALKSFDYLYDTSVPSKTGLVVWPYTLDFGVTHQECSNDQCPINNNYPGIWEVPVMKLPGLWNNCEDVETNCKERNATEFFNYYRLIFELHVNNSVPFGLFHSMPRLLANPIGTDGLLLFLDYLAERKNVYFVSIAQGIEWIRHPVRLEDLTIDGNHSLNCPAEAQRRRKLASCKTPRNCVYVNEAHGQREFISCNGCPYGFPEAGINLSKAITCSATDFRRLSLLLLVAFIVKHYLELKPY